jgi:hypothetical protein
MASNKVFNFGPLALTTTLTTNILNPPTAAGGVNGGSSAQYIILRHIRIVNKTSGNITVSFWLGATGGNVAGTEIIAQAMTIPPNVPYDWWGLLRLDSTQFLVGGCNTATAASIQGEGEIGVSG